MQTKPRTPKEETLAISSGLGIRGRLWLGFGLLTGLFIICLLIIGLVANQMRDFARQVIDDQLPTYEKFTDINTQVSMAQSAVRGWWLTKDSQYQTSFVIAWHNVEYDTQRLNALSPHWDETLQQNWQKIKLLLNQYKALQTQYMAATTTTPEDIKQQMTTLIATYTQIKELLDGPESMDIQRNDGINGHQYLLIESGTQTILKNMTMIKQIGLAIALCSVMLAFTIALLTMRSISKHINVFRQYSSKIASGDLTQYLAIHSDDEVGNLGKDLNTMTESLANITREIVSACQNMVTTLEEVKRAVDVQSSGATEQAASINEITASLEEIEKSSEQTMDKAKMLGEVAERTRAKGELGLTAVEDSIDGMQTVREKVQMIAQTILDLSNKTQQVGEITALVNTLAQQSKMLALNASIEAAKAGEAGKGFAVVAAEVKNLAEQSEQSTMQVQKILEDIRHAAEKAVMATEEGTKGVDHGTGLVEQTGEIIRSLSAVIHETTVASQQIEAAVRQEGVGIEQITAGMNEINQVTTTFVASANQTIEAISNLAAIAQNLKEQVDIYKM